MKKIISKVLVLVLVTVFTASSVVVTTYAECAHEWSDWKEDTPATCISDGQDYRMCPKCNETEYRTVPATGIHTYEDWYVSRSSCGEDGEEVRRCIYCDAYEKRIIPPTGDHTWSDWDVTKKATVFKKGKKQRECLDCFETQTKEIAKLKAFAKFTSKKYTVTKGKKLNLKKKLKFAKGDKVKRWKSSNRKAIVNKKGVVTARKTGTTKITVTMKSGKKATCTIKVKAKKKAKAKKKSGGTVYWTPYGKVYHSTRDCPTLSRSRTILSGPLSKCPKSRGCYVCN
ncbi:MAG: Ig-like domain-containing protein [Firmicutes bacterium]|nr:Ig-like domain-containing protein [Bacillota bacterium]